jgi:hypothetical protein
VQVVTKRNPQIQLEKPPFLSENERKKWWEIVRRCSQEAPAMRPTMMDIYEMLDEIWISAKGKSWTLV